MVEQAEEDARCAAEDTLIFHRGAAQTTYLQVLVDSLEVRIDLGLFQEKRIALVDVDLTDLACPRIDVAEDVAMDRTGMRQVVFAFNGADRQLGDAEFGEGIFGGVQILGVLDAQVVDQDAVWIDVWVVLGAGCAVVAVFILIARGHRSSAPL